MNAHFFSFLIEHISWSTTFSSTAWVIIFAFFSHWRLWIGCLIVVQPCYIAWNCSSNQVWLNALRALSINLFVTTTLVLFGRNWGA
jgi:hypothetical protein